MRFQDTPEGLQFQITEVKLPQNRKERLKMMLTGKLEKNAYPIKSWNIDKTAERVLHAEKFEAFGDKLRKKLHIKPRTR